MLLLIGSTIYIHGIPAKDNKTLNIVHIAKPLQLDNHLLYILLVAEMAHQRHMPELALELYLNAANLTPHPAAARQATLLAIELEAKEAALISAELWANKAPKDLQPQFIVISLLIKQSIKKAIPYLMRIIELQPHEADQYIIEIQEHISGEGAQNLKKALHQIAMKKSDPYVHLAAAQSAAQAKDLKNATRWVDSALRQLPNLTRAIVLKARLIGYEQRSDAKALQFLETQLKHFPNNHELRFFYATALFDNHYNQEAQAALAPLTSHKHFGGPALLLLSEMELKDNHWKKAEQFLKQALIFPQSKDAALYLLAEMDEYQGHIKIAIDRYSMIDPGPYHIPAILRAVTLLTKIQSYKEAIYLLHNSFPTTLTEQKHILLMEIDVLNASNAAEDAMQLADQILPKLPEDTDILYAHALTAIKLKQWDIAKRDLQNILKQNPHHTNALKLLEDFPLIRNENQN